MMLIRKFDYQQSQLCQNNRTVRLQIDAAYQALEWNFKVFGQQLAGRWYAHQKVARCSSYLCSIGLNAVFESNHFQQPVRWHIRENGQWYAL